MSKQKRFLITTADERTWNFDKPVIFLGEWCRLYNRKHVWKKMDSIVAKPYGLGQLNKDKDYNKANILEKKIFPQLCMLLNEYHGANHDERFWYMIIGHWFRSTINLLINRINTLEKCFEMERIDETTLYKSESCSLASPDWSSAFISFNNDQWNNVLNGRIISLLENVNISLNFLKEKNSFFIYQGFKYKELINELTIKRKIKRFFQKLYSRLSRRFIKDQDAFIINTYLPFKEEVKLELALGQWPQMWRRITPKIELKPDQILRKNLTQKFLTRAEDKNEKIIRKLLFELLPVYYLEAQKNLKKIIDQQPWPKLPEFIFTSNNFNTDEAFKLWAATKVEAGTKYYVGQHGGNYYTKKNLFQRIEERTSDKFLTWGWTNGQKKFVPTFIFKMAGQKKYNYNKNGRLLLIETTQSVRLNTWDTTIEHNKYFEDQKKFVSTLESTPKKKLIIRLNALFKDRRYYEDSRWYDFDKRITINTGNKPIRNMILNSRLVVHSYDSTGMLETLSQNIPTLAFWQNELDHLRERVKPLYQILIDAGILHLSAVSAANKINEVWNDVDSWWHLEQVQKARKKFCAKLIKECKTPVRTLISIINKK